MKQNIIDFLRRAFPFFITVGLWRLSATFWNPAGVLAVIPIFFCTFVRPVNWFVIFSILMCVCIDYKFETVCFWLATYCFLYSINAFQTYGQQWIIGIYGIFGVSIDNTCFIRFYMDKYCPRILDFYLDNNIIHTNNTHYTKGAP